MPRLLKSAAMLGPTPGMDCNSSFPRLPSFPRRRESRPRPAPNVVALISSLHRMKAHTVALAVDEMRVEPHALGKRGLGCRDLAAGFRGPLERHVEVHRR